jgi:hypothetical protein
VRLVSDSPSVPDTHSVPEGVPAEEVARLRATALDFGFLLGFAFEPDGGFMWASFALDGSPLQSGVADSWDDARLEVVSDLFPPSRET